MDACKLMMSSSQSKRRDIRAGNGWPEQSPKARHWNSRARRRACAPTGYRRRCRRSSRVLSRSNTDRHTQRLRPEPGMADTFLSWLVIFSFGGKVCEATDSNAGPIECARLYVGMITLTSGNDISGPVLLAYLQRQACHNVDHPKRRIFVGLCRKRNSGERSDIIIYVTVYV